MDCGLWTVDLRLWTVDRRLWTVGRWDGGTVGLWDGGLSEGGECAVGDLRKGGGGKGIFGWDLERLRWGTDRPLHGSYAKITRLILVFILQ